MIGLFIVRCFSDKVVMGWKSDDTGFEDIEGWVEDDSVYCNNLYFKWDSDESVFKLKCEESEDKPKFYDENISTIEDNITELYFRVKNLEGWTPEDIDFVNTLIKSYNKNITPTPIYITNLPTTNINFGLIALVVSIVVAVYNILNLVYKFMCRRHEEDAFVP